MSTLPQAVIARTAHELAVSNEFRIGRIRELARTIKP